MSASAAASFRRRAERPWRIALLVYALGLTVGTHWPRLLLDTELPITDKTLHLMAFGGLAVLLRMSGVTRRIWTTASLACAWAFLDEVTQGVPALHRDVNPLDLVGGILGVAVAALWIGAFADVGRRPNRARLAVAHLAFRRAFMRGTTWAAYALIPVLGVAASLIVHRADRDLLRPTVVGCALTGFVAAHVLLWRLWTREIRRVRAERACPACDASCAAPGGGVRSPCPGCDAERTAADWPDATPPGPAEVLRAGGPSFVLIVLAIVAIAAALVGLPLAWGWIVGSAPTSIARAARLLTRVPAELEAPLDLAAILALLAVAARLYRGRLAHCYDRTERCRACGHDLSGTPGRDGERVCGECGAKV